MAHFLLDVSVLSDTFVSLLRLSAFAGGLFFVLDVGLRRVEVFRESCKLDDLG